MSTLLVAGLERLAKLSPSEQAFLIQMGLLVVAVLALWVALKATTRRGR